LFVIVDLIRRKVIGARPTRDEAQHELNTLYAESRHKKLVVNYQIVESDDWESVEEELQVY